MRSRLVVICWLTISTVCPLTSVASPSFGQFRTLQGGVSSEAQTHKKNHSKDDRTTVLSTPSDLTEAKNLQSLNEDFQSKITRVNATHRSVVFEDFITAGRFMGPVNLIKLGDGQDSAAPIGDLTGQLKTTISDLSSVQKDFSGAFNSPSAAEISELAESQISQTVTKCKDEQNITTDLNVPIKYLLVFSYNLPALKKGLLAGHNYREVRICADVFLRTDVSPEVLSPLLDYSKSDIQGTPREGGHDMMLLNTMISEARPNSNGSASTNESKGLPYYWPVNIGAIYPTYSELSADMVNQRTLTLQAQPEWAGVGAGSITYSRMHQESYQQTLPTVVGMAEPSGKLQWIYYPAKSQQIAFGNNTAYAVLNLPRKLVETVDHKPPPHVGVQLNMKLEYYLKGIDFGKVTRMQQLYVDLADAVQGRKRIEMFARSYGRLLPISDQMQLERLLHDSDPADLFGTKKTQQSGKSAVAAPEKVSQPVPIQVPETKTVHAKKTGK
jgi:hypothetical protein